MHTQMTDVTIPEAIDHTRPDGRWSFNEDVARVFEDMLARSIPQHDVMRRSVFEVGCRFVQPQTAIVDPFCKLPTLSMICNIQDPITREDYTRDPRNVARKAANYLKSTGVTDKCYIGPEAEFFIFDDVRYDQASNLGFYYLDSIEGQWNRGTDSKAAGEGPNARTVSVHTSPEKS